MTKYTQEQWDEMTVRMDEAWVDLANKNRTTDILLGACIAATIIAIGMLAWEVLA